MKLKYILPFYAGVAAMALSLGACEEGKSYSDLLREEEKACNAYMANKTIELTIPADSVFETGPDAPYYKMDDQGYLYMQVIDPGDMDNRPKKGDMVYFRFMCLNLNNWYKGLDEKWTGNGDNLAGNPANFIYDDMAVVNSRTYGQGIQWPLKYLGYNCEVNLVIRSYYGFQDSQSTCQVYAYNVKYYRPEY